MSNVNLVLKGQWFDMILSGEKLEEYRELKPYWATRLSLLPYDWCKDIDVFKEQFVPSDTMFEQQLRHFNTITFRHGYSKTARTMVVECKGISFGLCRPEWSGNMQGEHFVISLGKILKTENCEKIA